MCKKCCINIYAFTMNSGTKMPFSMHCKAFFSDGNMFIYNLACCFVWLWNLVADIAGGKEAEGVWE